MKGLAGGDADEIKPCGSMKIDPRVAPSALLAQIAGAFAPRRCGNEKRPCWKPA
ncbi:hypothetical protein AX27061_5874 [Achromobacter xylosoxidans NBRC 15126 = ATCC 27061]|nr:hypothetical protein AX27061_5874 [Achromobacter xylosoxidans NBRC 15126 = ATCC 27061]